MLAEGSNMLTELLDGFPHSLQENVLKIRPQPLLHSFRVENSLIILPFWATDSFNVSFDKIRIKWTYLVLKLVALVGIWCVTFCILELYALVFQWLECDFCVWKFGQMLLLILKIKKRKRKTKKSLVKINCRWLLKINSVCVCRM